MVVRPTSETATPQLPLLPGAFKLWIVGRANVQTGEGGRGVYGAIREGLCAEFLLFASLRDISRPT